MTLCWGGRWILEDSTPAVVCKEIWEHYFLWELPRLWPSQRQVRCHSGLQWMADHTFQFAVNIYRRWPKCFPSDGRHVSHWIDIVFWMSKFFKSKQPMGMIDQRQLSDKIKSLYNGSSVCLRALSYFIGLIHEMGVTSAATVGISGTPHDGQMEWGTAVARLVVRRLFKKFANTIFYC